MKIVDALLKFITYLFLLGLLGSYSAPYINPNLSALSSLLGLAYHYLLIGNILLLVYWVLRWKRIALGSLFILLAGYPFMTRYYGMNAPETPETPSGTEILSYNVRWLDRYNWSGISGGEQQIVAYINDFSGDLVCLQEFPDQKNAFEKFPSYPYTHTQKDVAILSRRKIVGKDHISFGKGNMAACLYCDILLKEDTVRVYCAHLESYRLGEKDRQFFQEFMELDREVISQGVRSILSHLVAANKKRATQAMTLKEHIQASPYPVILCGDFNDTPISYPYSLLTGELQDCFTDKGRGVGNTYIGEFPSYRIDYILHDKRITTVSYHRDTVRYSDHFPIRAKIMH